MKVNGPNNNRVKCISKHCTYDVLCLLTLAPSHQQPLKHQGHPNQARPSPVSKVLRGDISNGQLGQHHLGTALVNPVQLVIENLPFSIHNGLVLLPHTHHCIRLTGHPIQTFLPITVSRASSWLHAGHLFLRFFPFLGTFCRSATIIHTCPEQSQRCASLKYSYPSSPTWVFKAPTPPQICVMDGDILQQNVLEHAATPPPPPPTWAKDLT